MTGLTPHRTIRRLRALGRSSFALGASLILLSTLAPMALADHGQDSDTRAMRHAGNLTAGNTCAQTDLVIGDDEGQSTSAVGISGVTGTGDVPTGIPSAWDDVQVLNVTADDSLEVLGVFVKGGPDTNEYGSAVSNMIPPRTHDGQLAGISHWFVCYRLAPPEADPAIVKSGPGADVQLGGAYSFTLVITNEGDNGSNTGPFTVSDTVPAGAGTVTGASDDSEAAECDHDGNEVTCDISDLSVEDIVTVTVSITAPSGNDDCGTVTNTASLDTDGDNPSTENDSSSDGVTIDGCEAVVPTPSIDVEKLVSLDGVDYVDADTGTGPTFTLGLGETRSAWFRVIVTNTSGDGTVLTLNSLEDVVTSGDADAIDLSDCTFPSGGLDDGDSVTCDVGPVATQTGLQHTNLVTVSATGAGQPVGDSDPANYLGTAQVGGVVVERPPAPAAPVDPPVGEPEPAPEVEVLGVTEELPRTGPEDLWLAGFALMLLGAGLLTIARGKAMDATAPPVHTSWTNHTP